MKKQWWHRTVGYQIYPKSFQDTNGDGIGDLQGVIRHLDEIAALGANVIWLCPVFPSPMADNGYDVSDYMDIDPCFGNMDDMKELIAKAKERGIRILMDLVANHSSDQHEWFRKALQDPYGEYGQYYVFREGKAGGPPNNWRSIFGGSAWEQVPGREGLYYLHLFTKQQPDLNWENPKLREEIYQIIRDWMALGLGGFRLDAISHLKKNYEYADLPPDGPDGLCLAFEDINNVDGLSAFLKEMKEKAFAPTDALTIGEYDNMKPEDVEDVIGENGSFSSIFDFSHTHHNVSYPEWNYDTVSMFNDYRDKLFKAQQVVGGRGLLCNFLENHDKDRCIDRFLAKKDQNRYSIRMLPVTNFFFPGIVFLYQGQEIGMRDYPKKSMDEYVDGPTHAEYEAFLEKGLTPEEALSRINGASREHSRTPMQWDGSENAGFTTGKPWFAVNPNYTWLNYEAQEKDPDSLLRFYRQMVSVRKRPDLEETFIYGELIPRWQDRSGILAYERYDGRNRLLIITSALPKEAILSFAETDEEAEQMVEEVLLNNYEEPPSFKRELMIRPWECLVLKLGSVKEREGRMRSEA